MDVVRGLETVIRDCPVVGVSQNVSEGEFDVGSILCFTDAAERPVVHIEHADGVVPVAVLSKENQRFVVFVLTDDGAGWQIDSFECGSDTIAKVVLASDVEMYPFHDEIGVIDETRECPREHPLLPIDVGGTDI